MLNLTREEFLQKVRGKRVPVFADVLCDLETPLTAYWKIAFDEPLSFLLESVTGGEQVGRYSLLGTRPRRTLFTKGTQVRLDGKSAPDLTDEQDPLDLLSELLKEMDAERVEGLPRFFGGAVGALSYDFVRFLEQLPDSNPDELNLPDCAMLLVETVVVFDHARNTARIICLPEPSDAGYAQAEQEARRLMERLRGPLPPLPTGTFDRHAASSNMTQDQYEQAVGKTLDYIAAGDGIQMVLSQRFSKPCEAHPVTLYRALRALNPSPYMFLLRMGEFDLIGASPELLVSHHQGMARVRPIAGTRPRGESETADDALAEELLANEKERAEHLMLIDLGRNDLGRVCTSGTVNVDQLMVIERYSHVMHIVSEVSGQLGTEHSPMDLIRATFPAGTLSGAPKVRAMEIIDELENSRRGIYGGAVGTITPVGDVDLAIAIRTVVLKDGIGHVQAGAGIVFDSDPSAEYEETQNKASAALSAMDLAQSGL